MLTINIIGCGRVGKTLGYLIHHKNLGMIQSVCNTSHSSSQAAVDFMGTGHVCHSYHALKPAHVYFIATQDSHIADCCTQILQQHTPPTGSIFVHFSGLLKSDILHSAKQAGYATASLHPLQSFANPHISIATFKNSFSTLEGDVIACSLLKPLFAALDCYVVDFEKTGKTHYHAASVIASNYVVSLFYHTVKLYISAGIPANTAKAITTDLMQKTLLNINAQTEIKSALTGPINRGDVDTVLQHITALDPTLIELYQTLGRYTLPLTEHSLELKKQFLELLAPAV